MEHTSSSTSTTLAWQLPTGDGMGVIVQHADRHGRYFCGYAVLEPDSITRGDLDNTRAAEALVDLVTDTGTGNVVVGFVAHKLAGREHVPHRTLQSVRWVKQQVDELALRVTA